MATVKYHYALDENDRLVSIKQAYLERNEGHTYHCLGCGAGMIARLGEVRTWHFAHRGDEDHCGTETYLHQLAKRRLSQVYCYHKSNISPFYKALIICSLCIGFQFGTCDNNIIMQDFSA